MRSSQIAGRLRDYEFSYFIQDADGIAIDATGWTWELHINRKNVVTPALTATMGDGIAVPAANLGRVDISRLAVLMTMEEGLHVVELIRTDAGFDTYSRHFVYIVGDGDNFFESNDITVKGPGNIIIRPLPAPVISTEGIPPGGTTGDVLTKQSPDDFDADWQPPTGGPGGGANLTFSRTSTTVTILSDSGTDAVLPAADSANAGVMLAADKSKLDGIAAGATANSSDATLLARANHMGSQLATTISDFGTAADIRVTAGINAHLAVGDPHPQYLTAAEGIAAFEALGTMAAHLGAGDPHPQYLTPAEGNAAYSVLGHTHLLANISDVTMTVANLNALDDGADTALHFHDSDRARANHTGSQAAATISDFSEAVDDRVAALLVAGTNITLNYNDGANTLTVNASGGGATDLDGLSDVVLASAARGDILRREAADWRNHANPDAFLRMCLLGTEFDNGDTTFLSPKNYTYYNFTYFSYHAAGAGAVAPVSLQTAKGPGVFQNVGTTATGVSSAYAQTLFTTNHHPLAAVKSVLSFWMLVPTLSTAGEEFDIDIGYTAIWAFAGQGANEVRFTYNRDGLNANWHCITRASSTSTITDSGVAVAANGWQHLAIVSESTGSVKFYIDGALVATHTTNIPVDPVSVGIQSCIKKSAGTTDRTFIYANMTYAAEI